MALHVRLARLECEASADADDGILPVLPEPFRLRTPDNVLELLERQIMAVARDARTGAVERARAIGYLATLGLKAIEASNLTARLEALEAALQRRAGNRNGTP